jgi:putative polyketide hydroxylase
MIEPVLLAVARERGGDLRFDVECTSFKQDDHGVRATLQDRSKEQNSETIVNTEYLIAAHGAGGSIRQKLNVATTGVGALGHLLNILFEADLREFVERREFSICYIDRPEICGLFTSRNNSNR